VNTHCRAAPLLSSSPTHWHPGALGRKLSLTLQVQLAMLADQPPVVELLMWLRQCSCLATLVVRQSQKWTTACYSCRSHWQAPQVRGLRASRGQLAVVHLQRTWKLPRRMNHGWFRAHAVGCRRPCTPCRGYQCDGLRGGIHRTLMVAVAPARVAHSGGQLLQVLMLPVLHQLNLSARRCRPVVTRQTGCSVLPASGCLRAHLCRRCQCPAPTIHLCLLSARQVQ
jgi:hypothetical protein